MHVLFLLIHTYIHTHIHTYIHTRDIYIYIYIYMYTHVERERERERHNLYIYIYIYLQPAAKLLDLEGCASCQKLPDAPLPQTCRFCGCVRNTDGAQAHNISRSRSRVEVESENSNMDEENSQHLTRSSLQMGLPLRGAEVAHPQEWRTELKFVNSSFPSRFSYRT